MDTKILIAIPARYASTRFPGKPLAKIAGKEMLLRVWENARKAASSAPDVRVIVTAEDDRIEAFCNDKGIDFVRTSDTCKTGTDRVREAIANLGIAPSFVINLQGDNPMCPPWFVEEMIAAYKSDNQVQMVTPVTRLSWAELDALREAKKVTPFSGTTAIVGKDMNALWFSKNIIPAIRKEKELREAAAASGDNLSPIFRHIGLYGYSLEALNAFAGLPEGEYEKLEGLEQLRFIENGYRVRVVVVDYKGYGSMSGIDSPEDVKRAEELFAKHGEF